MEIVHVLPRFTMGGTEKSAQILATEVSEHHDVSAYSLSGGPRREILEKNCVDTEIINLEEISEIYADVVHFHGARFKENAIEKVSDSVDIVCKTCNFGWYSRGELERLDYAFFISRFSMYRFGSLHPNLFSKYRETTRLIYYPVGEEDSNFDLRSKLDVDDETILVGKIGRPDPSKWSKLTVDAFKEFSEDYEDAKLVLVTPPERVSGVLEDLGIEGKTEIIGSIPPDEVSGFYEGIDVLAHSSGKGESFGYVIAESLAAGTPVVVNSNPMRDNAQIELVTNRKDGYIANNTKAYANSLKKAIENDLNPGLKDEIKPENVSSRYISMIEKERTRSGDDFDFDYFNKEYNRRLDDVESPVSRFYSLEKNTWKYFANANLPSKRLYDWLGMPFDKERKLNKPLFLLDDRFENI
jgi:glycosyltransferase involved in cell wall biosynthesis